MRFACWGLVMKQTCCDEFAGHLDTGEGGFMQARGKWHCVGVSLAIIVLYNIKYCPFCGAELEAGNEH